MPLIFFFTKTHTDAPKSVPLLLPVSSQWDTQTVSFSACTMTEERVQSAILVNCTSSNICFVL